MLILLFVSYQLWGTGILEGRAQEALGNEFEELVEERDEVQDLLVEYGLVNEDNLAADPGSPAPDVTNVENTSTGGDTDPTQAPIEAGDDEQLQALVDMIWAPPGDAIAQIFIPDIDVSKTVIAGVGVDALRDGPGHYPSTPLPGMPGNAAIAGHRTTYGAPFGDIDQLDPGDIITVLTVQGFFEYRVIEQENGTGHFIVSPDRVDVLDQDFEDHPNRLTLTACHPKFSARQRIIVVAELISEPAPAVARPDDLDVLRQGGGELTGEDLTSEDGATEDTTDGELVTEDVDSEPAEDLATDDLPDAEPNRDEARPTAVPEAEPTDGPDEVAAAPVDTDTGDPEVSNVALQNDDFGEGLNGDSDAVAPAVLWGLAAGAIWFAAWFIGRRWKKWPSYAIGIVPFAVVLFICFIHIDEALPSY